MDNIKLHDSKAVPPRSSGFDLYQYLAMRDQSLISLVPLVSGQPLCAFAARTSQSYGSSTQADVTSYTEDFDYGNNFASGIFTAPYTGLYQFNVVMGFNDASGRIDVFLTIAGATGAHAHGYGSAANADPTGNISLLFYMTAGDTAKVNIANNCTTTESLVSSSFSGFLYSMVTQ